VLTVRSAEGLSTGFRCGDLWGSCTSPRPLSLSSGASAVRVGLVLLLWPDWHGTVRLVSSASGDNLPPLKRKVIVLAALDLAPVVQLYGVGPSSWVWGRDATWKLSVGPAAER
jgi:hypothetical protein